MELNTTFQVVVTQDFRVNPRYTGLTQEQLDWLLQNLFWIGVSTDDGNYILTFHIPLPEKELTE
jgi:hypothetical protein